MIIQKIYKHGHSSLAMTMFLHDIWDGYRIKYLHQDGCFEFFARALAGNGRHTHGLAFLEIMTGWLSTFLFRNQQQTSAGLELSW